MKDNLNQFRLIKSDKSGQVVIILLLIALVALAIGLAVTQRSVTDLSTSTQSDQAARAFSAAEAGIERALSDTSWSGGSINLGNETTTEVKRIGPLPKAPGPGPGRKDQTVEFPKGTDKNDIAQIWLANPENTNLFFPVDGKFDLYFGHESIVDLNADETPAVEVSLVYLDSTTYKTKKFFIDPNDNRRDDNGFIDTECNNYDISTILSLSNNDRKFKCKHSFDLGDSTYGITITKPILVRVRVLYSNASHPIAIEPKNPNTLPAQVYIYTSQGWAGQSSKVIQSVRQKYVAPAFLDYAIYSEAAIEKL